MHKSIHSSWSVEKWLHFEEFWKVSVTVVKNLPQVDLFLFVFWRKWTTPFEINWHLVHKILINSIHTSKVMELDDSLYHPKKSRVDCTYFCLLVKFAKNCAFTCVSDFIYFLEKLFYVFKYKKLHFSFKSWIILLKLLRQNFCQFIPS